MSENVKTVSKKPDAFEKDGRVYHPARKFGASKPEPAKPEPARP
jgi:hypothetical protein